MNRKMILSAGIVLALVSLACTLNINLPSTQDKTGPTVTDNILVPFLPGTEATADVTLKFGAGKLSIEPGAEDALISGTATYNVADIKPEITTDSNNIEIKQGNLNVDGIPFISKNVVNEWKLSIGNRPVGLAINAGAYEGTYEFGGLSIHKLDVTDGAAKVNMSFSQPNQVEMTSFRYTTGASDVTLTGLGNANVGEMTFQGGAGSYKLDFGGNLKRDMAVKIDAGVSTVTVTIPKGVSAVLTSDSNLITINAGGDWVQNGNVYTHPGSGPTITLQAKMGAGTLQLETGE